jgi:hypothetical protein
MGIILSRYALGMGAAAALLAGCGGSQPLIGAAGAMPQSPEIATHAARGGSWMRREAARSDLLYVAQPQYGTVAIFSFPQGQPVGELAGFYGAANLCSDKHGDVWIMNPQYESYETALYEYPHGGTTPISTLTDAVGAGQACAVDPTTGNLAVANTFYDYRANVVVYPNASGSATEYSTYEVDLPRSATYDSEGDLFIAGQVKNYDAGTDWMPKGASSFEQFKPTPYTRPHRGAEWGDDQLTEMAQFDLIHRYAIHHGKAHYLGGMTLNESSVANFIVYKKYLIAAGDEIYVFGFPAGGNPIETITDYDADGIALSVSSK